jgi:hypothetical protein
MWAKEADLLRVWICFIHLSVWTTCDRGGSGIALTHTRLCTVTVCPRKYKIGHCWASTARKFWFGKAGSEAKGFCWWSWWWWGRQMIETYEHRI